jgi:allantoinase
MNSGAASPPYIEWSPISRRTRLNWPNAARLAVCVVVSLEHLEWQPQRGAVVAPSAVFGGAYPRTFDSADVSVHEYGNRVGIFRVMEVLDAFKLPVTAAIDAALVQLAPRLLRECLRRRWEIIGHGIALSRVVSEKMSDDEEFEYLKDSITALAEATGVRPRGWLSPDYVESTRTVPALASLGIEYVCDWANDEQPYYMSVAEGKLVSLPVAAELDEVVTHRVRFIPIERWAQMIMDGFDRLWIDASETGRLLVLNLHPFVIGQPARIKYLRRVLAHLCSRERVWFGTGNEIAAWYRSQTRGDQEPDAELQHHV